MTLTLTRIRLRWELRQRWCSLLVLALTSGCVLAAVAGARRAATVQDRPAAVTRPADVLVASGRPMC